MVQILWNKSQNVHNNIEQMHHKKDAFSLLDLGIKLAYIVVRLSIYNKH